MTDAAPARSLILVVDDVPAIRDLLRAQLEFADYEVLTAQNGAEAVAHLEAHAPAIQLVVLDPKCPYTKDAHDVLQALKRLRPGLPVLVVSGDHKDDAFRQLEWPTSGAEFPCDYLGKPYPGPELEAKVAALLDA